MTFNIDENFDNKDDLYDAWRAHVNQTGKTTRFVYTDYVPFYIPITKDKTVETYPAVDCLLTLLLSQQQLTDTATKNLSYLIKYVHRNQSDHFTPLLGVATRLFFEKQKRCANNAANNRLVTILDRSQVLALIDSGLYGLITKTPAKITDLHIRSLLSENSKHIGLTGLKYLVHYTLNSDDDQFNYKQYLLDIFKNPNHPLSDIVKIPLDAKSFYTTTNNQTEPMHIRLNMALQSFITNILPFALKLDKNYLTSDLTQLLYLSSCVLAINQSANQTRVADNDLFLKLEPIIKTRLEQQFPDFWSSININKTLGLNMSLQDMCTTYIESKTPTTSIELPEM